MAAGEGILVIARDHGPGIPDLQRALRGGYSTRGGLGLGLSGTKRLMDEFEIASAAGSGTTVVVTMWSRSVPRRKLDEAHGKWKSGKVEEVEIVASRCDRARER